MRRVRYVVATSLDGYIAGPNGEGDWIVMDPELDFAALVAGFDTLLMGRKTFAPLAGGGGHGGPFAGMTIVVASRTLNPKAHPAVTVVSEDLGGAVRRLKRQPGKDVWLFGGGDLFRSLVGLGLVDTVELAVIPVLLGQGVPLLRAPAERAALKLAAHRVYAATGTVSLTYEVAGARGSA
jgi:dihydrofolate reductase